jgi:thiol-disulfide isomerase/thioredoxin
MPTKKNTLIKFFLFFTLVCQAQEVQSVYKIDDFLKRFKSSDTVYVVNFWATWCKPCVEELPGFDSLATKTAGLPVKVLLVCLNFREEISAKVNPFLKSKGIKAECVLLDEVNGNDFVDKISPAWSGAIPATWFVYREQRVLVEKNIKLSELYTRVSQMLGK